MCMFGWNIPFAMPKTITSIELITESGLTKAGEKEILNTINKFRDWLTKKKIVLSLDHISKVVDMPFANEDWFIKMDEDGDISFNTYVSSKCSFGYFRTIVLHEFFHLAVQNVPNKNDAVKVKDDFGDTLMKLIDIEADFFTALYHKEELGLDLIDYLKFYYEGRNVFSDSWIRASKFERFIGTLLSIFKMFVDHPKHKQIVKRYDLYLPTIAPIYTENSLHILVIGREHIYVDAINASYNDFVELKSCYTNVDSLTLKGHLQKLVNFCCTAFNIKMPASIKKDLEKI